MTRPTLYGFASVITVLPLTYMLLMLDIAMIVRKFSWGDISASVKGFKSVKKLLENNGKNMWTSVEVYNYTECSGLVSSRQGLVAKLSNEFGKYLVILSSPGLTNIFVFHTHTAGILKLCQDDNEKLQDVSKVAKCI